MSNVPSCDGYVFLNAWLDKERGSKPAEIKVAGESGTYSYSDNQDYTLDALWASIGAEDKTYTYDGQPKSIDEATVEYNGGTLDQKYIDQVAEFIEVGQMTYSTSENGTYSTTLPTYTDVGTYTIYCKATVKVNGSPVELTTMAQLIIEKRNVTLTSATDSKEYDGTPLTNSYVTVGGDGWAEGEGATYNVTGSQTLVGSSPNYFSYELNENTKAGNYTIQKTEGKLTVRNREAQYEVTVTANSGEYTYDGAEKTVEGFVGETAQGIPVEADGNTYYVTGLTSEAAGTDVADSVASIPVDGAAIVKDAEGNDVTEQFDVKVTNGSLTINKATVTLTSANLSKEYDGEPLVNGDTPLAVETGWAAGEGASYTFTGSQTLVGNSANSFSYTLNSNTDAGNYTIQKTEGTLTVTDTDVKEGAVIEKSHTEKENGYALNEVVTFTIRVTNIYSEEKNITISEQTGVTITGESYFENVEPGETVETTATYRITEADILNGSFSNILRR